MTRIKQVTISMIATLAVTAAVAAPAPAYSTPNATLGSASTEGPNGNGYSTPNAIEGESSGIGGERVAVSSPNAILGASNVVEPAVEPVSAGGSTGFDWSDALIGAGSALGLVLLGSGAMVLARRRRHPTAQPSV